MNSTRPSMRRYHRRSLALALLGAILLASGVEARAQPSVWVVIPTPLEGAETETLRQAADALGNSLIARGTAVLSMREAAERYERQVSTPAAPLSAGAIEAWGARSQAAVRHLAHADYGAAREALLAAQGLSRQAIEELNRQPARARQVLDTCLYTARFLLETGDVEGARARMRECRQLVPGVDPGTLRHTPEVRDLLAEVDAAMASEPRARLEVRSAAPGCTVRLNGIAFGETPFRVDRLAAGDYRLQVECDGHERGRVHQIHLEPGSTIVRVDPPLERALRTRTQLALIYGDRSLRARQRLGHATAVARALGAARAVLVEEDGEDVRFDLVDTRARLVLASAWVPATGGRPSAAALSTAAGALAQARSVNLGAPDASRGAPWAPPGVHALAGGSDAPTPKPGVHRHRWGLGLVGVGAAALLTSWGLNARRYRLGERYAQTPPQDAGAEVARAAWRDARAPIYALAVPGALLSAAGAALGTRGRAKVPAWAWTLGAVGAAAAITGGVVLGARPDCRDPAIDPASCVNHESAGDLSAMLFASALPLLAVPAMTLTGRVELEGGAEIGRGGVRGFLKGRF